jgi:hypothetical protein
MAEARIGIVAEFLGKKAFGDAEKSTSKLDKGVKKLGAALLAAFSVQKIVQFGKAASKAFIEDEKAATRLAQAVKNLGLAFETPRIEEFISQMADASGVTDDQLRPAMQRLLQTTGSLTKSTELMTQALDVSRGSGIDFETVVNDLSMAYVGQNRGLKKYSLGLTQAELKTVSFTEVQERLAKNFTGANAAYLETYAGKLGILSNAASEAQETIGKGLVDSLSLLAGDGNSIQPLADSMQEFALYVSDAIYGVAVLIDKIKNIPGVDFVSKNQKSITGALGTTGTIFSAIGALQRLGVGARSEVGMGGYPSSALGPGYIDPDQAKRDKIEKDAAKRNKEIAALQKKTLDNQKKANALTKAAKTIDLDRISMTAALRGKISETDRLSLNLQLALLDKNEAQANKLSAELEAATKRQQALNAALLATPEAPNPYRNWKMPEFKMPSVSIPATLITATTEALGVASISEIPATNTGGLTDAQSEVFDAITDYIKRFGDPTKDPTVNVTVVLNDQEVGNAVRDASINSSLSGSFNTVNRTGRFGLSGTQ